MYPLLKLEHHRKKTKRSTVSLIRSEQSKKPAYSQGKMAVNHRPTKIAPLGLPYRSILRGLPHEQMLSLPRTLSPIIILDRALQYLLE